MIDSKIFKKIVFILIALIVLTVGIGFFYYERNIFSTERLRFEITAPERIRMGEEMEYILRYRNNSDTRLEDVVLIFEYPEGAIAIEPEEYEEGDNIIRRGDFRREVNVGELNPGEEQTTIFKARLIGQENESLEAQAWIRYVPRNLAARFDSKRNHVTQITEVPISFSLQSPSEVDPDREHNFKVQFSSQVDYPLTDLEVRMEYPTGFHFLRSAPQAEGRDRTRWVWPVLNRGETASINIDGVVRGDPGSAKMITAFLGITVGDRFVELKEITRGISVSRSNILMRMQVNGDEDYIASPGELLHYEVAFLNIGDREIDNLYLLVELDEEAFDFDSVEAVGGRFQEERGSIIWSYTFDFDLLSLGSGEGSRVEFWARLKEERPKDGKAKVRATLERATKLLETKIGIDISANQSAFYENSPFGASGPFPFREDETSTYAIRWTVESPFSDIEDVVIRGVLPEGARATGEKVMDEGEFSFIRRDREVKVTFDGIKKGEKEEVIFEVEITPFEDFGEDDIIVYEAKVEAKDVSIGEIIRKTVGAVFLGQIR